METLNQAQQRISTRGAREDQEALGQSTRKQCPGCSEQTQPIIRGWANYFRTAVAKEIFSGLDRWMFYKADRYTRRSHPRKSKDWRQRTYWGRFHLDRLDPWVFGDKQTGGYLLKFSWFPIERHTLVKGRSSPDDPHLAQTSGKPITQVARELGMSDTSIHQWRKELAAHGSEAFPGSGHQTALEEENRRLKRE